MTFPVTATSHPLADYRARGGYADAGKGAARDAPGAGHEGSGGLGHPRPRRRGLPGRPQVGRHPAQRRPAALPVRECRRRRARHLQGPLDPRERAAPAARVDADRGLRAAGAQRVRLHPRRIRPAVPAPGRSGGRGLRRRLVRRAHPRHRLLLRHRGLPRRGLLRLRRGVGADHVDRRQEGLSAQPPAAPDGARPVPAADGHQQRRDAGQRHRHRRPGRRGVPQGRHGEEPGHAAGLDLGPRAAPRCLRGRVRHPAGEVHRTRTAAACSAAPS